jgi:hypothetical protein
VLLVRNKLFLANLREAGIVGRICVVLFGIEILWEWVSFLELCYQDLVVDMSDLVLFEDLIEEMDVVYEILTKLENQGADAIQGSMS